MSEPGTVPELVRARPRRATVVCWAMAVALVTLFALIALGLRGATEGGGTFTVADQVAMVGLGVLGALGILVYTRPRVEADRRGIRVRNLIGSYDLPWEVVRSIRFDRSASWASLELADDDVLSVMAIQATDKEYAVTAVRGLRALHAAHQATGTP